MPHFRCCPGVSWSPTGLSSRAPSCRVRARDRFLWLTAVLCTYVILADSVRAADGSEFSPEVSAFLELNPRTRVSLGAAYALAADSNAKSKDLGAYLDISLKPIARPELLTEDWQRSRYVWARIGYDCVFEGTDAASAGVAENRGVIAIYGRVPLPAAVWLETRTRADLRWIGDEYSTRYRFRLDVSREFTVLDHPVAPYFNVEWFYDTRYDGWARTLYKIGSTVTVNNRFRYEVYLAREIQRLPEEQNVNALGVVLKWYY